MNILYESLNRYFDKLNETIENNSATAYHISSEQISHLDFEKSKEIGLHCGDYSVIEFLIHGKYKNKPFHIYKICLDLTNSVELEDLNDWNSLEVFNAISDILNLSKQQKDDIIFKIRGQGRDVYSSTYRTLLLDNNINVIIYKNTGEVKNTNNFSISYIVLNESAIKKFEEISISQLKLENPELSI